MSNYIEENKLNFPEIKNFVNKFYDEVKDDIEGNESSFLKIKNKLIIAIAFFYGLAGIFLILTFVLINSLIVISIFAGIFFIIGTGILIFYKHFKKKVNSKNSTTIQDYFDSKSSNLYQELFSKILDKANTTEANQTVFDFPYDKLIENFKFKLKGDLLIGITKKYEIINGSFFNKPMNLSCVIYHSQTKIEKKENGQKKIEIINYFEYIPALRIKINSFEDLNLTATNSKNFPHWSKNKLNFDNIEFRKKISVKSNNDMQSFMIFTALTQENWVKDLANTPNILMDISNGYINVVFKPNSNEYQTEKPFMNISDFYNSISNSKIFFNKLEQYLLSDFDVFTKVLNLIFCIPYFQWEEKNK